MLKTTILEDQRKGSFIRIYPSHESSKYDKYFIEARPLNKLQYKYLYEIYRDIQLDESISSEGEDNEDKTENTSPTIPLIKGSNIGERIKSMGFETNARYTQRDEIKENKLPSEFKIKRLNTRKNDFSFDNQKPRRLNSNGDMSYYTQNNSTSMEQNRHSANQSINAHYADYSDKTSNGPKQSPNKSRLSNIPPLITGDEYLIEYICRLVNAIKNIKEHLIKKRWRESIEKFIRHYVWHTSDTRRNGAGKLWSRLESRLIEMKERRKRLILSLYTKEKVK